MRKSTTLTSVNDLEPVKVQCAFPSSEIMALDFTRVMNYAAVTALHAVSTINASLPDEVAMAVLGKKMETTPDSRCPS